MINRLSPEWIESRCIAAGHVWDVACDFRLLFLPAPKQRACQSGLLARDQAASFYPLGTPWRIHPLGRYAGLL